MAKQGLTVSSDIELKAREIDFTTRFPRDWTALQQIMGVSRLIERVAGTKLTSKYAEIILADGHVAEGEEAPYSEAKIKEREYTSLDIERHQLAVTLQAVNDHGYNAIALADQEMRYSLVSMIMGRYYEYSRTGTLTAHETNFQMVMGFSPLFLLSDSEIPRGMIVATPVENINIYYVSPSNEDFRKAGFDYTTDTTGGLNMIGAHIEVKYGSAESIMHTLFGISMFSEYLDGIAVVTFGATAIGTLTVSSAAGTESGDTALTVTETKGSGNVYKIRIGDTAINVANAQNVKNWTAWDGSSDITAATGKVITVVEADNAYKAVKVGSVVVTAKA